MNSQTTITITHDKESTVDLKNQYQSNQVGQPRFAAAALERLFSALAGGARMGSVVHTIDDGDGVKASGTVTFSSLANNDTVTIAGVVLTAKTSGASGSAQFNLGASDTDAATNATVKINAHASLAGVVTATSALGVITVTSAVKGLIGNQITLAISAHGSVSAANLAGGTNSANSVSNTYAFGV